MKILRIFEKYENGQHTVSEKDGFGKLFRLLNIINIVFSKNRGEMSRKAVLGYFREVAKIRNHWLVFLSVVKLATSTDLWKTN